MRQFLALLLLLPVLCWAQVYKWKDARGVTHYSDKPPAAGAQQADLPTLSEFEAAEPTTDDDAADGTPARALSTAQVADCLSRNGARFYGASWCGICRQQLKLFGAAAGQLPYVECSADGSKKTTSTCDQAGVKSYPTWVLPGGQKRSGLHSVQSLSRLGGCTT